ncbi:hypothetical protein [Poseidonibacter antarcticus]|uniref:hypothetical protein n=1 Tax=Poseidonibacter antarcticus TaxID=2478538 RepID=UPI000EF4E647|nr:hypothetical protein [Poseidonibacter antarcticus]
MILKEYDEKRIEYIFKRIDTLHKSIMIKLTIFTIVIVNIYFTKLWNLYINLFEKIIGWVKDLLSNHIPLIDSLKLPELLSYTFYGTSFMMALLIVIFWIFFSTFELSDINKLKKELKRYDNHYNINIKNIEDDTLFKKVTKIMDRILNKT